MSRFFRKIRRRGECSRGNEDASAQEVTRRVTRGEARRLQEDNEEDELNRIIYGEGLGYINFVDIEHKRKFVELMSRTMKPTRFIDRNILISLGLDDDMKRVLKKSGCSGLFKMEEHTYWGLTLEFLSSYHHDIPRGLITFRLFDIASRLTLAQFGDFLGCRFEGDTSPKRPRDGEAVLWKALTLRDDFGTQNYKFKTHLIHHPVLRLWCRYVASIYFARPESTNLKGCEIAMLFSLLNFDSGKPFTVNVAHHIALHFTSVVAGTIKPISMGGLVTRIAKKVYPSFDESILPKLEGSPPNNPLCFDEAYLLKLHYIDKVPDNDVCFPRWDWLLQGCALCRLPVEEGPERPFKKVVTFT